MIIHLTQKFLIIHKNPLVNAESQTTIKMQKTGLPITGLLLAILALFGGLASSKRK